MALVVAEKSSGGEAVSFGLDIGSAPVPSRRYYADACTVECRDDDVRLVFAQRGLTDGFDSALVVRVNPIAARQLFDSLTAMKSPSVPEIARRVGVQVRAVEPVASAKQMVSVVANFAAVAVSGWEACIDFYHASAFAMRAMGGRKSELELEPVVRIDMGTGKFMGLLEALKKVVADLPAPPDLKEDEHGTA